ncbi:ribosome maturation factor RimM [Aphanothece sacrum]|uniref:Ribosome maturation factor RimM n=1 Tax=Aphanothece sacrum FPU1 TaxID=1920663 RepID=A0A401IJR5_APHSA|nr:ribosome maturation factor RimM [Aphanothece sacrum]GBF81499.1 16S rRNA-processing protein RimM [Aphanothece sacrum FPU1]GBF86399.1 16S rRNA-processing protein RimM [Aphanothece sacrum FPU3]
MKENTDNWLEIGKIVAAQGLKGELKVVPSTDFPERFEQPGQRWLQPLNSSSPQPVGLISGRYVPGKDICIIRLEGIETRTQAEALKGYKLLVLSSDRVKLEKDEYHVSELINLEVYHQKTGELIGIVTDIFESGHDLLEIELNRSKVTVEVIEIEEVEEEIISNKKKEKVKKNKILIPFVYDIVPVVDLDNKRIEINPPKGLLELVE